MPRIYTRTGDRGETGLCDGSRTTKSNQRVDLYGEVDELNSALGVVRAQLASCGSCAELQDDLLAIQSDLFELGALLADPPRSARLVDAGPAELGIDGAGLEPVIDRLEAGLPPLRSFILPGGDPAAAALASGPDRVPARRAQGGGRPRRRSGRAGRHPDLPQPPQRLAVRGGPPGQPRPRRRRRHLAGPPRTRREVNRAGLLSVSRPTPGQAE